MTFPPKQLHRAVPAFLAVLLALPAGALAAPARVQTISYRGLTLSVPAGFKVLRLRPHTCVRFDRPAIYLGTPGTDQACQDRPAGRTQAVLIQPDTRSARPVPASSTSASFTERHLLISATWNAGGRGTLERILRHHLEPAAPAMSTAQVHAALRAHETAHTPVAQSVYQGPGFDACTLPSNQTLAAWEANSDYRAFGLYVGGEDAACPASVTPSWSYEVTQQGWHLIPIYVGLQAPVNSCACTAMSKAPATAESQGAQDAQTAVQDLQADGLAAGNPVYDDIEAYTRSTTTTAAVLAYQQGWTSELHALGYLSGVYVAADSGAEDLVARYGTGYLEPDELWVADWNSQATAEDPNVPAGEFSGGLIHQYRGAHNETYGGQKLNVDSDYLDADTAVDGTPPPGTLNAPTLQLAADPAGGLTATPGWSNSTPVGRWRLLGGFSAGQLAPLAEAAAAAGARLSSHSTFPYYAIEAIGTNGTPLATSTPVSDPAHVTIFGHTAFAPPQGLGGVPVGCYTGTTCRLSLTLRAGRTTVASTSPEPVAAGAVGVVWFALNAAGRRLLVQTGGRLLVQAALRDSSGVTAVTPLTVDGFTTFGRTAKRVFVPGHAVRLAGGTAFVSGSGFGGLLVGCSGLAPCSVRAQITLGRTVLASTGPESVGANELGYVFFELSAHARQRLTTAVGNQLPVHVVLVNAVPPLSTGYGIAESASASIVLARAPLLLPVSGGAALKR